MQRPWYKQFWPWFLITLPMCAVTASLYTFYLASSGADSMVVDDYYKKGRAYNKDLTQIKRAAELNMQATLVYQDDVLTIKLDGDHAPGEAIRVNFTHPTLEKEDHALVMTTDSSGVYRQRLDAPFIDGYWNMQIAAMDSNWRIQKRIQLPIEDESLMITANKDDSALVQAANYKMFAILSYSDDELAIVLEGKHKVGTDINVHLSHSQLDDEDYRWVMHPADDGSYRQPLDAPLVDGLWSLEMGDVGSHWRLQKQIELPTTGKIMFNAGK